jgi:hypothetical protein
MRSQDELFEKKVSITAYSSFMKELKIFPQSQARRITFVNLDVFPFPAPLAEVSLRSY